MQIAARLERAASTEFEWDGFRAVVSEGVPARGDLGGVRPLRNLSERVVVIVSAKQHDASGGRERTCFARCPSALLVPVP